MEYKRQDHLGGGGTQKGGKHFPRVSILLEIFDGRTHPRGSPGVPHDGRKWHFPRSRHPRTPWWTGDIPRGTTCSQKGSSDQSHQIRVVSWHTGLPQDENWALWAQLSSVQCRVQRDRPRLTSCRGWYFICILFCTFLWPPISNGAKKLCLHKPLEGGVGLGTVRKPPAYISHQNFLFWG
jgi:hypothetical protein